MKHTIMELPISSGTQEIGVMDNNDRFTSRPSMVPMVVVAIDRESMFTLSRVRGAKSCENFFDSTAGDPIEIKPFQVTAFNSSTGSRITQVLKFTQGSERIYLSSSLGTSITVPRKLLKRNKFGDLADLIRLTQLFVIHSAKSFILGPDIKISDKSREKAFKRAFNTFKENHGFKRKNQKN